MTTETMQTAAQTARPSSPDGRTIAGHQENDDIAGAVQRAAARRGLHLRRNITTTAGWCGYWRYVVADRAGCVPVHTRHSLYMTEAPYSRSYRPSVLREREALRLLWVALMEADAGN